MLNNVNIEKALKFPIHGENWIKKFLINTGLSLSVVGLFFISGYRVKIVRIMIEEDSDDIIPPDWRNFREIFIDSLILNIVQLIWGSPFILIILMYFGSQYLNQSATTIQIATIFGTVNIIIKFLSIAIFVITLFFITICYPMILGEIATKKTIKAGINFGYIFSMSNKYFSKNRLIFVINIVFTSLFGLLSKYRFIFFSASITAYRFVFLTYLQGKVYREITYLEDNNHLDDNLPME